MKQLGKIAVTIVIILVILYGIYFAGTQGWLEKTPLKSFNYEQLNFLNQESVEQTKILTERAKETTEHMQTVLGDKVEIDQEAKDKEVSIDHIIGLEIAMAEENRKFAVKNRDPEMIKYWEGVKDYFNSYLKKLNIEQVRKDFESGDESKQYASKVILSKYNAGLIE